MDVRKLRYATLLIALVNLAALLGHARLGRYGFYSG
jgi:hypothetical protein